MSDMTIAVVLACLWAISGLAVAFLLTCQGLRTLRSIRADRRLEHALVEDDEVAQLDGLWELPVYRKRETA